MMKIQRVAMAALGLFFISTAVIAATSKPDIKLSVENWLNPDVNTWTFRNTEQIIPSATVSRGSTVAVPFKTSNKDISSVQYPGVVDGKPKTLSIGKYLHGCHPSQSLNLAFYMGAILHMGATYHFMTLRPTDHMGATYHFMTLGLACLAILVSSSSRWAR